MPVGEGRAEPAAAGETAAPLEPLRTAGDRPATIRNIKLDLRVDLHNKTVDSKATIQFRTVRPTADISLDAVDFELKQVTLATPERAATAAKHKYDGKKLIVDLGSALAGRASRHS